MVNDILHKIRKFNAIKNEKLIIEFMILTLFVVYLFHLLTLP